VVDDSGSSFVATCSKLTHAGNMYHDGGFHVQSR